MNGLIFRPQRALITSIIASIMAIGAIGCPPIPPQPSIDDLFEPGSSFVSTRDGVLLSRQPVDPRRPDPIEAFRGAPGRVIPAGTLVKRLDSSDSRVDETWARGKIDPKTHVWVAVEVRESVFEAQKGWFGWINTADIGPVPAGFKLDEARSKANMSPDQLSNSAWLCAFPDGSPEPGPKCEFEVHPSLSIRLLGCQRGYGQVALWDPSGVFVSGFVRARMFKRSPCP